MLRRMTPFPELPAKSQEVCVTVPDGRSYVVCSKGQYEMLRAARRQQVMAEAGMAGRTMTDEGIEEAVESWLRDECPYAPLDLILSKMSPDERERWKQNYRFSGITTRK